MQGPALQRIGKNLQTFLQWLKCSGHLLYFTKNYQFAINHLQCSISKAHDFKKIVECKDSFNECTLLLLVIAAARNHPFRSSRPEMFLRKGVLKICSKFPGEHPCRSNFIEVALRHGCSPGNWLHIFRTPFPKNTSGRLLLNIGFQGSFICRFCMFLPHIYLILPWFISVWDFHLLEVDKN